MKTSLKIGAGLIAASLLALTALPALAAENTQTSSTTPPGRFLPGPKNPVLPPPGASSTVRVQEREEARTTASSTRAAKLTAREDAARQQGIRALDVRIASLTKLIARINAMPHLSADQKAALVASVNTEIAALTALKTSLAAETSTTTLKADLESITKGYRIYALVEPQALIIAAADRALGVADMLTTLSGKLAPRVASSTNATTLQPLLTDMNAKIADARIQAQAAITAVVSLKPDNGDTTIAAANTAALKDARVKIAAAQADLRAAQKDAESIVRGLRK